MRFTFAHIVGAFLLPVALAHNKRATNGTSTNTTSQVEGLLASGAGKSVDQGSDAS